MTNTFQMSKSSIIALLIKFSFVPKLGPCFLGSYCNVFSIFIASRGSKWSTTQCSTVKAEDKQGLTDISYQ